MRIYSSSFIIYLLIELITPFSEKKVKKSSIAPLHNSQNIACGVSGVLDDLEKENQAIDIDAWAKDRRMPMAPYTIPIVVHLIEDVPTITDAQVQNAIAELNNAFANGLDVPGAIPGANTQIDFCLAVRAPDGGLTNGINRITSPLEEFDQDLEDSKLKTMIGWDPRHYLNIWTVGFINSELAATYDSRNWWSRGPVGGYATLPGSIIGANSYTDGVAAAGLGVGLWAHEVGHYMGLLHTFEPTNEQDCVNDDCETDGDMVCDTPPDSSITDYFACGGSDPNNSCGTDTLSNYSNGFYMTDVDDDFRNFMDYGNGACQAHFTEGQKNRMLFHIDSYRTLLYTQAPSNNDACNAPCISNVTLDFFTQSENNPVIGMPVTFESTSANATNFEWYVELIGPTITDDYSTSMLKGYTPITPPVAVTDDLTHPFPTEGKYRVYLKAWDTDPNCFASYSRIVRVGCGVDARFYPNKRLIASKQPQSNFQDTVTFFNRSVGATTYEWTVKHLPLEKPDGTFDAALPDFLSSVMDLEYIFPEPGMYEITLKAINGACEDSIGPFELEVEDPTIDANLYVFGADCFNEDSIRVSYQVWNRGYDTLSAGMPISFYEQDPRSTDPSLSLLKTIFSPEIIYGSEAKNYIEYVKRPDLAKINNVFVAFNDPGTTTPPTDLFPEGARNALSANVNLPASGIPELYYGNNVHWDQNLQFGISATPVAATVCQGDTYDINIAANDTGGSFTTDWQVNNDASLACSNCLNQTVTMGIQSTTVELEVTSAYGCKESITFNLTVSNPATTINSNPEICLGTASPNFNTFVTGGGHTWYTSSTAVTGVANPTVDTSTAGSGSLWVTKSTGTCEGTRVKFDYTIKPAPLPTINNPTDACVGDTAPIIADIVSGSGTFKWYNADTGGSQISEPTPNTSIDGTFEYWVTQITDGCESVRSLVSYIVHPIPQSPVVTATPVCINDGVPVLSALVTGNNLIWYDTSNAVIAQPDFATDVAGTFNYFVTQTVNDCESPKAALNYEVKPLSDIPEVIAQLVCINDNIPPLSNLVIGTNLEWYDTNGNVIGQPGFYTDIVGIFNYFVTQTTNGCESPQAPLTYDVKPLSAAPQIDIIADKCLNEELFALTDFVTGMNVQWYTSANSVDPITVPIGETDVEGTITHWVTQNINGCESQRATVSYVVHPIPQNPVISAPPVCINDGIPLLSDLVTGNNLIWYDTNSAVIAQPDFATDVAGTFNYFVTQTVNDCESLKSEVNYEVKPLSDIPEVISQPVCINDNIPTLSNLVTGNNLEWYDTNGNVIVQPSFDTDVVGIFNYFVTQTTNGCESPQAPLTYEVKPLSVAPQLDIIGDKCLNDELFALSDFVTGLNVQWYSSANSVDPITVPIGKTDVEGTITHWVTQNINGCESQRTPLSYVVHPIPEMPTVSPIDICLNDNSQKLSDYVSGENLTWHTSAVQGDGSAKEFRIKTDVAGSHMYWVTQTIKGCVSPRAEIPYIVYQIEVTDDGPYKIDDGQTQEINLIINQTPDLGPVTTTWFDASGQIGSGSSIAVSPIDPTFYSIDIENDFGCITEHEVYVNVIHFLYSAEIFSPNGDGLNEVWQIRNIEEFPTIKVSVYNRWGKIVFESLNYSNDWNGDVNGTPLPIGTYYFVIDQSDYDRQALTGSVTIIR